MKSKRNKRWKLEKKRRRRTCMDRRRAQEHRRWRNHDRSWIFFFNGELLRKLLVMFPRSFTQRDRRRRVDRKHHRRRNHGRSSISCGGDSSFTFTLSLLFFRWRMKWREKSCGTLRLTAVFFGPSRTKPSGTGLFPRGPRYCGITDLRSKPVRHRFKPTYPAGQAFLWHS